MNKNILKTYLVHLLLAILSVVLFLFGISAYLDSYTKHGKYINTPNLIGVSLQQANVIIQNKHLRYSIIDSIYVPEKKPGIILSQNPEPNTKVKENRNIYLTITSFQPPTIEMPKLVDLSERQAVTVLKGYDLKLGKIIYELSYCNGCVVAQLYKGKKIQPGEKIKKNSVIDIVVGQKENKALIQSDTINNAIPSFDDN